VHHSFNERLMVPFQAWSYSRLVYPRLGRSWLGRILRDVVPGLVIHSRLGRSGLGRSRLSRCTHSSPSSFSAYSTFSSTEPSPGGKFLLLGILFNLCEVSQLPCYGSHSKPSQSPQFSTLAGKDGSFPQSKLLGRRK
jgi:hypothetical protein